MAKGTRAHTHRELIREWLWELKGSSLEYIEVLGGGSRRRDPMAALRAVPQVCDVPKGALRMHSA